MAEQTDQFLQPFIPKENTAAEPELSISGIILRFALLLFIAIVSLYANHEASKGGGGIDIAIDNAVKNTPAGRRFSLIYIYNDKAAQMAIQASGYIEDLLYSESDHYYMTEKKQVDRVTVRLIRRQNLTEMKSEVSISSGRNNRHQFLIQISLAIMDRSDHVSEMMRILRRAMARVWIYDNCPKPVVDGMVELLAISSTLGGGGGSKADLIDGDCWMGEDPRQVARFLEECERQREGFIQGMRHGWSDRTVDNALGIFVDLFLIIMEVLYRRSWPPPPPPANPYYKRFVDLFIYFIILFFSQLWYS